MTYEEAMLKWEQLRKISMDELDLAIVVFNKYYATYKEERKKDTEKRLES